MDSSRDVTMGGEAPGPAPPRRSEMLGPRPALLKVRKDPGKIKKLPSAAPLPPPPPLQPRQPVIIYTVSPKVVHTTPGNFMSVVQRLTGGAAVSSSSSASAAPALPSRVDAGTGGVLLSPAAAAGRAKSEEDLLGFDRRPQTGLSGGILTRGPSSLPWISPSLFTPTSINLFNELSPLHSAGGGRSFPEMSSFVPIASPNNNFSSSGCAVFSPATGYGDLFNQHFFDS